MHLHFPQWRGGGPRPGALQGSTGSEAPPPPELLWPTDRSHTEAASPTRDPAVCGLSAADTREQADLRWRPLWQEGRLCGGCSKPSERISTWLLGLLSRVAEGSCATGSWTMGPCGQRHPSHLPGTRCTAQQGHSRQERHLRAECGQNPEPRAPVEASQQWSLRGTPQGGGRGKCPSVAPGWPADPSGAIRGTVGLSSSPQQQWELPNCKVPASLRLVLQQRTQELKSWHMPHMWTPTQGPAPGRGQFAMTALSAVLALHKDAGNRNQGGSRGLPSGPSQ